MANFLFTLIQIIIFKMNDITDYLVGNDDSIIRAKEDDLTINDDLDTEDLGLELSEKMFSGR
jgi:hypothetical protein